MSAAPSKAVALEPDTVAVPTLSLGGPTLVDLRRPAVAGGAVLRLDRAGRDGVVVRYGGARVGPRRAPPARLPMPLSWLPHPMSARDFLIRGLLAGLLAGFSAFGGVRRRRAGVRGAIALEEAGRMHHGHVEAGTAEPRSAARSRGRSSRRPGC